MDDLIKDVISLHQNRFRLLQEIKQPKLGWLSIYTPTEIIAAAGITPYRITGETKPNSSKAGGLMHRNICSYVLSSLEEVLTGGHDFSDGAVIANACDARRRLYDVWRYFLETKFTRLLDLPRSVNPGAKKYYKNQLLKLIGALEQTYACKITEEKLRQAISSQNETRRLLQKLYELRKENHPPITGAQAIQIVKSAMTGLTEDFNAKLAKLLDELYARKTDKPSGAGISAGSPRILICGSYFDHIEIAELLEKTGAAVVCEDISNGVKYFEGCVDAETEPVGALAEYYLEKASCARMIDSKKRFDHLWSLIEEYKADSVIYFSLKFCDNNLIDFAYQKERLNEKNIPVLFLEIERSATNLEQIKTRIQTFIETQAV